MTDPRSQAVAELDPQGPQRRWLRQKFISMNYMWRWYLLPGVMLHVFWGSDNRSYGLHNHPGEGWFVSITLWGRISEHIGEVARDAEGRPYLTRNCAAEDWPLVPCRRIRYTPRGHAHAVVLHSRLAVTLVVHGRWKGRPWGFFSPKDGHWRDQREVLALQKTGSKAGAG